jgi:hypothetical protein
MSEAFATVARVEARSELEVLNDLLLLDVDVVRVHRPADDDVRASIALSAGALLLQNATELVTASAVSAVSPRRVISARRPTQALDYLNRVQLGQTERSSFVLTIVSKVEALNTPGTPGLLEYMEEPFPRKVIATLARGLSAAKDAITQSAESGRYDPFDLTVEQGVSANLCEALAGIISAAEPGGSVNVSIGWAAKRPAPTQVPSSLTFERSDASLLLGAAKYLRHTSPLEGLRLTGVVVNLHREEGQQAGVATIATVIDGSVRKLSTPLTSDEYAIAIDAHREQRAILFRADAALVGRTYRATNVSDVRLVD